MRTVTADFLAQLLATEKTVLVFFEGVFATGTVRFWSGTGDIPWDGQTWLGGGEVGSISPITETGEIQAHGISVSLSGIPDYLVALVLGEVQQGKLGKVWLGFLADDGTVVVDPALMFIGRLDVPTLEDGATTSTISITYENRLRDLDRAREFRHTKGDQDTLFGVGVDLGFDFVPSLQEWNEQW